MRRSYLFLIAAMFCALLAGKLQAQFAYPPDLVDKLRIVGITEWEFAKPTSPESYIAHIKVQFENRSDYHVVFRDPSFHVIIRTEGDSRKLTGTVSPGDDREKRDITLTDNNPAPGVDFMLSELPVRLPTEDDIKEFHLIPDTLKHDQVDQLKKQKEFSIKAAGKDGKPTIQEVDFIVDFGPAGTKTADHLLLKVFNTVMGHKKPWSVLMSGQSRVGCRGLAGATVFSAGAIDIEIANKPPIKLEVNQ